MTRPWRCSGVVAASRLKMAAFSQEQCDGDGEHHGELAAERCAGREAAAQDGDAGSDQGWEGRLALEPGSSDGSKETPYGHDPLCDTDDACRVTGLLQGDRDGERGAGATAPLSSASV